MPSREMQEIYKAFDVGYDVGSREASSELPTPEIAGPVSSLALARGWEGLRKQRYLLGGKREEARQGWQKWKDDPLMQDIAESHAEAHAALSQIIDFIDSRLLLAPPNNTVSPTLTGKPIKP